VRCPESAVQQVQLQQGRTLRNVSFHLSAVACGLALLSSPVHSAWVKPYLGGEAEIGGGAPIEPCFWWGVVAEGSFSP